MKASLTSLLRNVASASRPAFVPVAFVASPVVSPAYSTPRSILASALLQAQQLTKATRSQRIASHQRIDMGKGVQGYASASSVPLRGRLH